MVRRMIIAADICRRVHRPAALRAAALVCVLAGSALADRGGIAAYTLVNGTAIEVPLAGLSGDAARGAMLFADPQTGACASCHAIAGRAATGAAPAAVVAALAPPPPAPPTQDPALDAPPADAAPQDVGGLGPLAAPLPLPRGFTPEADGDVAALETDAAAVLPQGVTLTMGPGLDGVGARLGAGAVRLWVVDPGLAGGTGMPAYHAVDFAAAARAPDLRQPWLTAQQVEDLVAYLTEAEAR
jgi:hypothetical protein